MTKEKLNSIILASSRHDRFGNELVARALPQLFEAVIQAWQEIDALKAKLAEAEEKVDELEMGYRGFP